MIRSVWYAAYHWPLHILFYCTEKTLEKQSIKIMKTILKWFIKIIYYQICSPNRRQTPISLLMKLWIDANVLQSSGRRKIDVIITNLGRSFDSIGSPKFWKRKFLCESIRQKRTQLLKYLEILDGIVWESAESVCYVGMQNEEIRFQTV